MRMVFPHALAQTCAGLCPLREEGCHFIAERGKIVRLAARHKHVRAHPVQVSRCAVFQTAGARYSTLYAMQSPHGGSQLAQKVRDAMTGIPITLAPDRTLTDAARAMREYAIGCVLVALGEQLCGLVTDRDIVVRAIAESRDPAKVTLSDICTLDMAVVAPDDDLDYAITLMRTQSVRRLPVVEAGRAVGLVTIGDLAVARARDSMPTLAAIAAARPCQ
jgi:CBS domain-containing protein